MFAVDARMYILHTRYYSNCAYLRMSTRGGVNNRAYKGSSRCDRVAGENTAGWLIHYPMAARFTRTFVRLHTSRPLFSSMADISGLKVKTGVYPHRHRSKRPRSMARRVRNGKGRGRGVGLAARSSLGVKVVTGLWVPGTCMYEWNLGWVS